MKRRVAYCIAGVVLTAYVALSGVSCRSTNTHPASSVLRVSWLLTDLANGVRTCLVQPGRSCSLSDLQITSGRWGTANIVSSAEIRFEEYDVKLLLKGKVFCAVAVPSRLSDKFNALWIDTEGRRVETPYPWVKIPAMCKAVSE